MVQLVELLQLAGSAAGAIGGLLLFIEFFQLPSYVEFNESLASYQLERVPKEVQQYTWLGRIGSFLVALGFSFLFLATLIG
ncbi:MAG: hypothetical protein ACQETI_06865 [Halobacteriota archaeon]